MKYIPKMAVLLVSLVFISVFTLSPVSIQTQSLVLRALRKRKPQETQALTNAIACVSCGFRLRKSTQRKRLRLNGNRALG